MATMIGIHVDCGGAIVRQDRQLVCERCGMVIEIDGRCVVDLKTGVVVKHERGCSCGKIERKG